MSFVEVQIIPEPLVVLSMTGGVNTIIDLPYAIPVQKRLR